MGDLISRAAAIEALGAEPEVWNDDDDYRLGLLNQWQDDVNAIKDVPSAERRGKWIERNPLESEVCRLICCSECDKSYIVPFNVPYKDWAEAHKYCVECGARMEA